MMRLSGARPKRTWNMVVSSSTDGQQRKCDRQRLVERARLLRDLGGVAGDRHEIMALVAEIDIALDQPQPLILRRPRHSPGASRRRRRRRRGPADAASRRPTASARSARRACRDRAASPASTSPTAAVRTAARPATAETCRRSPRARRDRRRACADRRRAGGRRSAPPLAR